MKTKTPSPQPTMIFEPGKRAAKIGDATSVLEVALQNDIDLSHSCGGMGSCTTCRVFVESDLSLTNPRTEIEEEVATRGFLDNERLGCQLDPHPGLIVRVPNRRD